MVFFLIRIEILMVLRGHNSIRLRRHRRTKTFIIIIIIIIIIIMQALFFYSFFVGFLIRSRENISRFHFGIVCLVSLGSLKKGCTLGLYSSTPPCESYCCNPYMGKVLSPSAPSLLLQLAPKIKPQKSRPKKEKET